MRTVALEREAPGPEDTVRLGRRFGELAPDGAVLLLEGPLGSGKTTFAQGVAEGCGVAGHVASPTFNLVLHYEARRPFVHADLYRLEGPEELETLDLEEILSPAGLACIEWPELVAGLVRPPHAVVGFARVREGRRVTVRLAGEGWSALAAALGGVG